MKQIILINFWSIRHFPAKCPKIKNLLNKKIQCSIYNYTLFLQWFSQNLFIVSEKFCQWVIKYFWKNAALFDFIHISNLSVISFICQKHWIFFWILGLVVLNTRFLSYFGFHIAKVYFCVYSTKFHGDKLDWSQRAKINFRGYKVLRMGQFRNFAINITIEGNFHAEFFCIFYSIFRGWP